MSMSFKTKIVLSFTGVAIFCLTASGVVSYIFNSRLVTDLTLSGLSAQLDEVEETVHAFYANEYERQQSLMTRWQAMLMPRLKVDTNPAEAQKMLVENQVTKEKREIRAPRLLVDGKPLTGNAMIDSIAEQSDNSATFFVRIDEGLLRVATSVRRADGTRAVGTYIPNDSPVYKSIIEGKPYVGRAVVVDQWQVTAYTPIIQDGQVVGAIFLGNIDTAYSRLQKHLGEKKLLQSGYYYILDSQYKFVLHPTRQGESVAEATDSDGNFIFKQIVDQKQGAIYYRWPHPVTQKPQEKIAIFRYFPELDWYVAASLNEDEAMAAVRTSGWILFTSAALAVLVLGGLAAIIGMWAAKKLQTIEDQIASASEQVKLTAERMNQSSQYLAESVDRQSSSVVETASALDEIKAMVDMNLNSVKMAETLSSKTKNTVRETSDIVGQLNQSMSDIDQSNQTVRTEIQSSLEEIRKIMQMISSIKDKTNVINDIVFQTKLLSFNASVEAARAGEHGKGFAVVADEVGKLAAMSGASATEISSTLEESSRKVHAIIETSQQRIIEFMDRASRKISEGVAISRDFSNTLQQIPPQVSEIHQAILEIARASDEQARGISEISKAMTEIDKIAQENALSSQKALEESKGLSDNASDLNGSVVTLNEFMQGSQKGEQPASQPQPDQNLKLVA